MSNLRPSISLGDEVTGSRYASQSETAKREAKGAFESLRECAKKNGPIAQRQFERLCEKFPIAVAQKVAEGDGGVGLLEYLREQLKDNPDFLSLRMAISSQSAEWMEEAVDEIIKAAKDVKATGTGNSESAFDWASMEGGIDEVKLPKLKCLMATFYMKKGLAKKNGDDPRRISKCELYMLACFQDVKDNPFGKKYLKGKYENACKRLHVKVKDDRILIDSEVDDLFAPPFKDLPERIKSAIKSDDDKKRIAEDKVDKHLDAFPVKVRKMFVEGCAPQDIADYLFDRLKTPRFSKLVKQMHKSLKLDDDLRNSLKGDWKSLQKRADAILGTELQEACKRSVYVGYLSDWFERQKDGQKDDWPESGRFLLWLAVLMLRATSVEPKMVQRCELLLTYYYSLFELGEDYGEGWPRKLDYTLTYTVTDGNSPYTYFCNMFNKKLKESVESGLSNTSPGHDSESENNAEAVKENCEFNKKLKESGLFNTFPDYDPEHPRDVFEEAVKENCAAVCAKQALNEAGYRLENEHRELVQPRIEYECGDFDWMTNALPYPEQKEPNNNCVPVYAKYPGATVFAMSRSFLESLMRIFAKNKMIDTKNKMITVSESEVQSAFHPADDSQICTPGVSQAGVSWVRVFAQLQGNDNKLYAYVAVFPSNGGELSSDSIEVLSHRPNSLLPVLGRRLVVLGWDIKLAIEKYKELCTSDNGSPAFGGYQKINGLPQKVDGDSPNPFAMYFKPNIKKEQS